jgi:hypothetical protein
MREDIACILIRVSLGAVSLVMCPGYRNGWCKTLADPRLAIKLNCLLTLFIVIFANGLGARTDFHCWNAVMSVVPAANKAVPGTSSCVNQCLLHISTLWPEPVLKIVFVNLSLYNLYELAQICNETWSSYPNVVFVLDSIMAGYLKTRIKTPPASSLRKNRANR